jgi:hypothetical protein
MPSVVASPKAFFLRSGRTHIHQRQDFMQGLFTVARFARCISGAHSRTVLLTVVAIGIALLLLARPVSALPPLEPIAFSGTQAPGMAPGVNFLGFDNVYFQDGSGPTIGPNGEVLFYGTLTLQSSFGQLVGVGIWEHDASGLELIAVSQDHASGFARGVNYSRVTGSSTIEPQQFGPVPLPIVDDSGNIAYSGYVQGLGVGAGNDEVLWDGPRGQAMIVAQEGSAAPGTPSGTTFKNNMDYTFPSYAMNSAGNVAITSGTSGKSSYGIWEGSPGNLTPVVRNGDATPGISGGKFQAATTIGYLASIVGPAINDSGHVAFEFPVTQPNTSPHDAVWVGTPGSLSLVARAGDHAPGAATGVTFADPDPFAGGAALFTFSRPEISSDDQVAFAGLLTGTGVTSANGTGIWAGSANNLQLVARAGDQAPGLAKGEVFGNLYSTSITPTPLYMNAHGKIVFAAPYTHAGTSSTDGYGVWTGTAGQLTLLGHFSSLPSIAINGAGQVAYGNSTGIWITDSSNRPTLVASANEPIAGANGQETTIYGFQFASGSSADGFGTSFNDAGQLVFQGSAGIFTVDMPPLFVPEPTTIGSVISACLVLLLWIPGKRYRFSRLFAAVCVLLAMASILRAATPVETIAITGTHAPDVPSGITFSAFAATTSGFTPSVTPPVPPSINAAGEVAFYGYLAGIGVTTTNSVGIWTGKSGDAHLTALESDNVAGLGAGVNFLSFDPSSSGAPNIQPPIPLNAGAQIAVSADLSGIGISTLNDEMMWSGSSSGLNQFVQESPTGFHASSSVNPTFGNAPFLNDAGDIGFSDQSGLWLDHAGAVQAIARSGQHAPGVPLGTYFTTSAYPPNFASSAMNATGAIAFLGALQGSGVTSSNQFGIWAGEPGDVRLVVREGDTPPGISVPMTHVAFLPQLSATPFSSADMNSDGTVVFAAYAPPVTGIWSGDASGLHLVVADGQQAPGLASGDVFDRDAFAIQFGGLAPPLLNAQGALAFQALVSGPDITAANNAAIFSGLPGSFALIAQTGTQAPGTPVGTTFLQLGLSASVAYGPSYLDVGLNGRGQVAFKAQLSDGTYGLWGTDLAGHLREVVRQGDMLQVAPGDNRTVSGVIFLGGSGNSDGRASGLSDNGQIAFWASFTDGSSGIFVSNALTVPEPATLPLAAIAVVVVAGLRRRSIARHRITSSIR